MKSTRDNVRCIAMMNIYTVCFFGHRYIERGTEISDRLDKLLHDLIDIKNKTIFNIQSTLKTVLGDIGCGGWI